MNILPFRKILSVVFFLVATGLLFILFTENNIEDFSLNNIFIYAGIFFSILFLLILYLTKDIFQKKELSNLPEDIKTETEKPEDININLQAQIEKHTKILLKDINKHADIKQLAELLFKNFAKDFRIVQGIFFVKNKGSDKFQQVSEYAVYSGNEKKEFAEGDGITGQVALNKDIQLITDIAEDYITVLSGLGTSSPTNLLIIPFVYNNETIAVAELAAFESFPKNIKEIYAEINKPISEKINSFL